MHRERQTEKQKTNRQKLLLRQVRTMSLEWESMWHDGIGTVGS